MNVLILGAGASRATHELPIAREALGKWKTTIIDDHKLLGLALDQWVGADWVKKDLESAWTRIDVAWKERNAGTHQSSTPDLSPSQCQEVWRLARHAAAKEAEDLNYYKTQIKCARYQGHSTEQFLSVAAGWELRRLIQNKFAVSLNPERASAYRRLLDKLQPQAVISFNYDTLLEQSLKPGTWAYCTGPPGFNSDSKTVAILKPHGSVDWTHRLPQRKQLSEEWLLSPLSPLSPERMGYNGNWLVQNLVVGLREKIEHTPAESSRMIRGLFRNILGSCEQVLAQAEKIWVVGYSFQPADTGFLTRLSRALAQREKPPVLSVIDKGNPCLLSRIPELFEPKAQIHYCLCGLKKWTEHGFCNSFSVP